MTIECHYSQCRHHGTHAGEDGPFCFEQDCHMSEDARRLWDARRRVISLGYDPDELDEDNPYTQWGDS